MKFIKSLSRLLRALLEPKPVPKARYDFSRQIEGARGLGELIKKHGSVTLYDNGELVNPEKYGADLERYNRPSNSSDRA